MTKLRTEALLAALRENPHASTAALCAKLDGINKSTLTRALNTLGDAVIIRGGSRRIRYALRRPVRGLADAIPLYRIDEQGRGAQIGLLDCVYPEGTALALNNTFDWPLVDAMQDGWFDSLPYPLVDMRPQGFLGRNFARHRALDFQVSQNPDDWSDDDVVHVLSLAGYDQPGNLILGETAYRRFLEAIQTGRKRYLNDTDLPDAYPQQAETALAHGDAGSSAAGEFPKFTASRLIDGQPTEVLVKFSGADGSPAVQRWADLLVCEHLALEILETELGVPAAQSRIYRFAGRTFLEVERFDRHGAWGRSAVCTLSSLNAALVGMAPAAWPKVAARFHRNQWLSEQDVSQVEKIWWFGRLIANTDMHEGNLAFRPGLKLAPVYDMLPMHYAPARGGEVPAKIYTPELPLPPEAGTWLQAENVAIQYWKQCAEDDRISSDFRAICRENAIKLEASHAVATSPYWWR